MWLNHNSAKEMSTKSDTNFEDEDGSCEELVIVSLQGFAVNRQRRSLFDEKFRRRKGMSEDGEVVVPRFGVLLTGT